MNDPIKKKSNAGIAALILAGILIIWLILIPFIRYDVIDKNILQSEVNNYHTPSNLTVSTSQFYPGHCFDNCPQTTITYTINDGATVKTAAENISTMLSGAGYNNEVKTTQGSKALNYSIFTTKENGKYHANLTTGYSSNIVKLSISYNHNV